MEEYYFREFKIPGHMLAALKRYVEIHQPVGDFLTAVIENNLSEAVAKADDFNIRNLPAFTAYLYNEVDSECWGSPEKRKAWLLKGLPKGAK